MQKIYSLIIFCFTCFLSMNLAAQKCGNCNVKTIIARYDLDVQIPQPELKGEKTKGWLEWMELFKLSAKAGYALSKSSAGCIRFTQPPDANSSDDKNDILKVGTTYTNLPPAGDVSDFGNYITTGYIKQQGDSYIMHMEVQAACSRKIVASADVPFFPSSIIENSESIAQQAASQLSPLIEKIKKYELEERNQNSKFAVAGNDIDLIKVTPAKTKLLAGQQTEFTLELKDCDGVALPGREIVFTGGNINGNKMPGTIGGIVTPIKVITDAQGKAKAIFKMTATANKPAIINAYTVTQSPQNCQGVLYGDAQIDAMPAYKVTVNYISSGTKDFKMSSDEDGVAFQAGDSGRQETAFSFSLLYYPETDPKDGEQIIIMPRFEDEPEYKKSMKGKTVILYNDGYYESTITGKNLDLEKSPFGAPERSPIKTERKFYSEPLPPSGSLLFKNNELVFFSAGVDFPTEEEGIEVGRSFGLNHKDKELPVKPKKVTDSNSPYKWYYEFQYRKEDGYNKQGQVFKTDNKDVETATIQIWKSF